MFDHINYGALETVGENRVILRVTAAAFDEGMLIALSAAGPSVAAQSAIAHLLNNKGIRLISNGGRDVNTLLMPILPDSRTAYIERFMLPSLRQLHITVQTELMFSQHPAFQHVYTWEQQLVPRLLAQLPVAIPPQWVMPVIEIAKKRGMIKPIESYGCSVVRLSASDEMWIDLISEYTTGRTFDGAFS